MNEHTKNRWQKRCRHEAHDGDAFGICNIGGRVFKGIHTMVRSFCMENANTARVDEYSLER